MCAINRHETSTGLFGIVNRSEIHRAQKNSTLVDVFFTNFSSSFSSSSFLHFFVALILLSFFIFLSSCLFLIFWLVLLVQIIFVCENSSWIVSFYFYDSIFFQLCFSFFCVFVWWVEDNVKLSQKWNTKKKSFRSSVRLLRVNLWWGEWNDRKICVFFSLIIMRRVSDALQWIRLEFYGTLAGREVDQHVFGLCICSLSFLLMERRKVTWKIKTRKPTQNFENFLWPKWRNSTPKQKT